MDHEMFHAFQDDQYGNTNQYGMDPVTRVPRPGFVNLEFEQAMMADMANGYGKAFEYSASQATTTQKNSYNAWLATIVADFSRNGKNQFIFIILALLSTGCYAQNKYPKGLSKVNGETFQITYTGPDNDFIVVYNVKSKYSGVAASDNPRALLVKREDIHFDVSAANAIVHQALKIKKEKLHKNEDFLHIELVFERSGKLADISYGIEKKSLISMEDLANIDTRLREVIRANFTGNAFKDYKYLSYSLGTIRFE